VTTIWGYGEDGLTYWALSQRMGEILRELEGKTEADPSIILYRPSFGRGRGCFGEFDAIIGTQAAVYLVEAKWDGSGRTKTGGIALKDKQIRRHRIFADILTCWQKQSPNSWAKFCDDNRQTKFGGCWSLPRTRNSGRLLSTLEFLLPRLSQCGDSVVDVVLFCKPMGQGDWPQLETEGFRPVRLEYEPLAKSKSGVFQIAP
jgi:hypothetical protein